MAGEEKIESGGNAKSKRRTDNNNNRKLFTDTSVIINVDTLM